MLERCQLHMGVKLDEGLGNKLHGIPLCVGDPLSTNIPQTAGARKCVEGVSKATDGIWLCDHLLAGTFCNHLSLLLLAAIPPPLFCTIKILFSSLYALQPLPCWLPSSHSTFCCTWQVTESWVGAWKQGYHSLTLLSHVLFTNGLAECSRVCLWIRRHWTERSEKVLGHNLLRVWTPLSRVSHNLRVTTTIILLWLMLLW